VSLRRAVFLALAGAGLVVCLISGYVAIRVMAFVHRVAPSAGVKDVVALVQAQIAPSATAAAGQGRVNVLLMGYGGTGHDGPYLTDSLMVVSTQTATDQVAMISVPRDIWIPIPTNRSGLNWTTKINAAYTIGIRDDLFPYKAAPYSGPLGGGNLASEIVHRVTGLPIQYWVAVDFTGFRKMVDAVGGIDITVPQALDDPLYPLGDTHGYTHIHFNAGPQHMNGEQALEYARSRETTSDFDRSRRQQLILLAVRRKVLTINGIPKLLGLMDALQDHIRTNMNLVQIQQFAAMLPQLDEPKTEHISLDTSNFLYSSHSSDGQYILLPYDPAYRGLHEYLQAIFPDPLMPVEATPIRLLNGTTYHGSSRSIAELVSQLLQWEGLAVLTPGNAPPPYTRQQTEIIDYSGGDDLTVSYLKAFFNADVVPGYGRPPDGAMIEVIIGRDFASTFLPAPPPPPARPRPAATARPSATPTPSGSPSAGVSPSAAASPSPSQ
jgi:LCP family protein required for cell wall assembly